MYKDVKMKNIFLRSFDIFEIFSEELNQKKMVVNCKQNIVKNNS